MDKASKEKLDSILGLLSERVASPNDQFSKGAAIGDVAGVVKNLFNEFKDTALPEIFSIEAGTGGYSSTAGQLLANDAFARTMSKAAQVTMENVERYAKLDQGQQGLDLQGVVEALKLQAEATGREATAESYSSKNQSLTKGKGGSAGIGFGG